MSSFPTNYPDYREISTPWEPAPIVWRVSIGGPQGELGPTSGKEGLEAQATNSALTHLVREVYVSTRRGVSGLEMEVNDVLEDLALVDAQFEQLESLTDLKVAKPEWHVFSDETGLTRTLARVAIIDGDDTILPDVATMDELSRLTHLSPDIVDIATTFLVGMDTYYKQAEGRALDDIYNIGQFKYGTPRTPEPNPMAEWALFLVDIEPCLEPADINVA